ncbi:MAG TPA: LPS export ABC transporter periplasmic protein LptC [Steroidobacteraceae bacterium]|jgi:LPS export ABC transporter protein LptC|nr:LPS export ABC transporter periplasmic protein LptC [Steroidobacteraceae bacterium]
MLFRVFTVLAVIALAVSTWILSSPARRPLHEAVAQRSELPGYYLKNAVLTDYDLAGNPGVRIEAERIDQIDHGNEVELHNVRVAYQAPNGQTWTMVGDTAHVEAGAKDVDVSGNVRLQGEPTGSGMSAVIHTDTLRYDVADAIASTKSDVRIDFGAQTLSGRGLLADLKDRTIRLESRVNGRFHP